MKFFDAHCDTIVKVEEQGVEFLAGPGSPAAPQVTLSGLRAAGVCAQVFAVFVLERRVPGRARERALELMDAVRGLCAARPRELALAADPGVVAQACRHSSAVDAAPTAVIVGLEGADPLEGDPEALRDFHRRGARLITLAWDDNAFCGAVFGESGAGLSERGHDLVTLCEELGVMVDVSHATDAGFWDVCHTAARPFVASHSNCRAVSAAPRNLSDAMIRALAERGGVMGINLESGFLSEDFRVLEQRATDVFWEAVRSGRQSFDEAGAEASRAIGALPRPPLEAVMTHVRHAIDVGGEDCVGLGGDLDGIDSMPLGIEGVQDYPRLADLLRDGGLTEAQVEKVCWRNFARVWREMEG
jgi:membrane dipeptidase